MNKEFRYVLVIFTRLNKKKFQHHMWGPSAPDAKGSGLINRATLIVRYAMGEPFAPERYCTGESFSSLDAMAHSWVLYFMSAFSSLQRMKL